MPNFTLQTSFSAGEISPALYGFVSLAKYHSSASTMRNMWVSFRGGAYSRAGTAYVNTSKTPAAYGFAPPRLLKFQFNINQGYALEFGDHYMRVFDNGEPVVEAATTITGISNANPAAVTDANSYSNDDWIIINGVTGMTQVNGNAYRIAGVSGGGYVLHDLYGNPVDSTAFGAYTGGGTASRIFTLVTPWAGVDLPWLKITQSADVMSICCVNQMTGAEYPPYDLARIAVNNWTVTQSTFAAQIAAPAPVTANATVNPNPGLSPPTLPAAYAYVVTAVNSVGDESVASAVANVTDSVDISVTAGSIIINWDAVPGAIIYNVYKAPTSYNTDPGNTADALPVPVGAIFAFVGQSYGTQFVDSNITATDSEVPPIHNNPFARGAVLAPTITSGGSGLTTLSITITTGTGSGAVLAPVIVAGILTNIIVLNAGENYLPGDAVVFSGGGTLPTATINVGPLSGTYPGCVAYFSQRRAYAASLDFPDTFWMSKPGNFLNFDSSIPVTDGDAITASPWSQQVNGIQWMVPMPGGLVTLTGLGAWLVGGQGSSATNPQPITPTSIQAIQNAFNGADDLAAPLPINFDLLYVQAKGSIVRDLSWNFWLSLYTGADLTQLSGQLFTGYQLVDPAWCEEPYKVAWFVRNDGVLLSLTYLKEQEVYGWARHDTLGQFISAVSVTEPPVDALYVICLRPSPAGSGNGYTIERMDNRIWKSVEDVWAVDCGLENTPYLPPGFITALSVTGSSVFLSNAGAFTAGMVGQVIRMSGGIATITGYTSADQVTGTWTLPPNSFYPNAPTNAVAQQAYPNWSITAPITTVTGLQHLAGRTVTGLADGIPITPRVVSAAGTITLDHPASNVKVGLGFTAQLQLPRMDPQGGVTVQGRRKTVVAVTARIEASCSIMTGTNQPDGAAQAPPTIDPIWTGMQVVPNQGTTYPGSFGGTVNQLFTGDVRVPVTPDWATPGQIAFQQNLPLPVQIVSVVPEFLEGDLPEVGYQQQGGSDQQERRQPRAPGNWMISG